MIHYGEIVYLEDGQINIQQLNVCDFQFFFKYILVFYFIFYLLLDDAIDWKRACIEREDQYELWTNFDEKMIKHTLNAQYGNIDCLHLMNVRMIK